jgi:protein-disulfide isomerase
VTAPAPNRARPTRGRIGAALGLVVVIAAVALGIGLSGTGQDARPVAVVTPTQSAETQGTPAPMGPAGDLSRRIDGDPLALGRSDAPVVMVVYSDYRCPFCAKFSKDIEPALVDRYVADGTLRLEWRDLPIFGEQSTLAARAGRAAADQGRFWEFNRVLYAAAPDRGHHEFDLAKLRAFAHHAGVADLDRFADQVRSEQHDDAIQADLTEALSLGASSTPTFIVNGTPVLGAQPVEVFDQIIRAAAGR